MPLTDLHIIKDTVQYSTMKHKIYYLWLAFHWLCGWPFPQYAATFGVLQTSFVSKPPLNYTVLQQGFENGLVVVLPFTLASTANRFVSFINKHDTCNPAYNYNQ